MKWPVETYADEARSYLIREDIGLPEEYEDDLARWIVACVFGLILLCIVGFGVWIKTLFR